tara:strand:+ start:88 stop:270 length:183 start_codon:yes stop_codon:yes gene_type:complete
MKNLLLTLAVASLMACNSTDECSTVDIRPEGESNLPFDLDSITNVNQLLDSLSAMPSTHH